MEGEKVRRGCGLWFASFVFEIRAFCHRWVFLVLTLAKKEFVNDCGEEVGVILSCFETNVRNGGEKGEGGCVDG